MANLLSLSVELLVLIYSSSATIQTAALFSGTNQRLRAVWLEHGDIIIASILEPQTPAYKDAVGLAILEETWTHDTHPANSIPVRLCLSRLLRNADLASSATTQWDKHEKRLNNYIRTTPARTYTSKQASYYLARKLLLARQRPESRTLLLSPLHQTLVTSSIETLHTHDDLLAFLTMNGSTHEERLRHDIPKPKEEWSLYDVYDDVQDAPIIRDEWDWVRNVVETALMDKLEGKNDLEGFMFDDRRAPGYYRQYGRA
jgi:hypothetical protein